MWKEVSAGRGVEDGLAHLRGCGETPGCAPGAFLLVVGADRCLCRGRGAEGSGAREPLRLGVCEEQAAAPGRGSLLLQVGAVCGRMEARCQGRGCEAWRPPCVACILPSLRRLLCIVSRCPRPDPSITFMPRSVRPIIFLTSCHPLVVTASSVGPLPHHLLCLVSAPLPSAPALPESPFYNCASAEGVKGALPDLDSPLPQEAEDKFTRKRAPGVVFGKSLEGPGNRPG